MMDDVMFQMQLEGLFQHVSWLLVAHRSIAAKPDDRAGITDYCTGITALELLHCQHAIELFRCHRNTSLNSHLSGLIDTYPPAKIIYKPCDLYVSDSLLSDNKNITEDFTENVIIA